MTPQGHDFETWVRRYHGAVYQSAWRILRREADALDVTQEVFLSVARDDRALREARSPERLLRWRAGRAALAHLRAELHRRQREDHYAMGRSETDNRPEPAEDERRTVLAALAELSVDLRQALFLRFHEGLTFEAIAAEMGCSEPTAHGRVQRGLEALRRRLAPLGFGAWALDLDTVLGAGSGAPAAPPPSLERRLLELESAASGVGAKLLAWLPALLTAGVLAGGVLVFNALGGGEEPEAGALVASADEILQPPDEGDAADPRPSVREPLFGGGETQPEIARAEDPTPALPPRGVLTGRVVDADGLGIGGARVEAFTTERQGKPPRFEVTVQTLADGSFRAELPVAHAAGQLYRVSASHRDHVRATSDPLRVRAEEETGSVTLRLAPNSEDLPGDFVLALALVDPEGAPLADVQVALVRRLRGTRPDGESRIEAQGHTDAGGRLELSGDRLGAKELHLDGPRWQPASGRAVHHLTLDRPGYHEEVVVLAPGRSLRGRMRTVDGAIPEYVSLYTTPPGELWGPRHFATIEADGSFSIDGLGEEPVDLWGRGPHWSTLRLSRVDPARTDLVLFVKPVDDTRDRGDHLGELHGLVVDAATGEPMTVSWLAVEATRLADGLSDDLMQRDAIPCGLSRRPYQVGVPAGGAPPDRPDFHKTGLLPGNYLLTVSKHGRAIGHLGPVRVNEEALVTDLRLPLEVGGSLEAQVLDPVGRPLANAWVALVGEGPASDARAAELDGEVRDTDGVAGQYIWSDARSDKTGRFRLPHLPTGLHLRLAVSHAAYAPLFSEPLELTAGAETKIVLRFTEPR